ncbi:hypothetical protein F5146DRAFT_1147062 [Armillaria mellea]|nr:hypothetical protein F5146DRAFT_1147062 [Armillaria mellea]
MPGYHFLLRDGLLFVLLALARGTIFNILWSSLATIVACIWVAIHPNVPGNNLVKKGWFFASVLRRAELMVVAIFAPSVITIWSFRQRFAARSIRNLSPAELTLTHGFLVSMGAFVYSDRCPVTRQNLKDDRSLVYELSQIKREEIKEHSKRDGLSKGLAVVQATWFLIQCATRLILHLPVTVLEAVAVGYAIFTVINYVAWWDKPLGILIPFQARALSPPNPHIVSPRGMLSRLFPQQWNREYLLDWVDFHLLSTFFGGDVMEEVAGPSIEEDTPRLWSGHKNNTSLFYVVTGGALLTTLFGAAHFAAWFSHFATSTEKILWRAASLYITLIPMPLILMVLAVEKSAARLGLDEPGNGNPWFAGTYRLLWILFYLTYIISQGFLLLEPFFAMRSLPHGAFVDIAWTHFLPHV